MNQQMFGSQTDNLILTRVHPGTEVYDADGSAVGKVKDVYLGEVNVSPEKSGEGPATVSPPPDTNENLLTELARAMVGDRELPDVLRNRLLRYGYIHIDTHGLFASDCFALPEQVAVVTDEHIKLNVSHKELIKLR